MHGVEDPVPDPVQKILSLFGGIVLSGPGRPDNIGKRLIDLDHQPVYIAGDGQGGCQAILSKYEPAHI